MLRTLYAKLSLSLVALLIAVGVMYTLLSFSSVGYYLEETGQKLNIDLARNLVTDRNLVESGHVNKKAISATFMEYMIINPSIELYLLDLQGHILSYSAEPGKVKRNAVSLAPIKAFLNGEKLPLLGDDPRSHDRQKTFSVTPIPNEGQAEGYLYVVLHGEQYDNAEQMLQESLLWKQTGLALIISLFISLVIGLLLFRKLTRRLNSLAREMDNFCNGDFTQFEPSRKPTKSSDEIDQLGNTFNRMAGRLVQQLDELKRQDHIRRELVANVSHDLRTPVAILHGYLETLCIKADTITPSEQLNYIQQALRSSERLNILIAELFELAKLDAHEAVPHKDNFNLSELTHDIVQKFQLKAKEKGIELALHVQEQSILAYADIGLIARVLENLLDNALKFTPDQEHVDVYLTEEQSATIVRVEDGGPGIPADELPKIFDRFYQGTDNARIQSAGLGLAIVRRIIELHGGSIEVLSTPSSRTVFTFTLPR